MARKHTIDERQPVSGSSTRIDQDSLIIPLKMVCQQYMGNEVQVLHRFVEDLPDIVDGIIIDCDEFESKEELRDHLIMYLKSVLEVYD